MGKVEDLMKAVLNLCKKKGIYYSTDIKKVLAQINKS